MGFQLNSHLPLPSYTLNHKYDVVDCSKEAIDKFGQIKNIMDIVEEGSINKLNAWVRPDFQKMSIEINMINREGKMELVTLYAAWQSNNIVHAIILEQAEQISKISTSLSLLRKRLNETNIELLQEKEKLETLIEDNDRLSAPVIRLTPQFVMIPLFGILTESKMNHLNQKLLFDLYEESPEHVLFDFTAVGDIEDEGLQSVEVLLQSISLMGMKIYFVSINQTISRKLHSLSFQKWDVQFISSVHAAMKNLLKK
ncbi:hypothetical protein BTS2_2985 [Bacillus sp. TS-2]|nr:hypothetical protein BTS2_2985 [Bacillus sp. TS-2]